MESSRIEDFVYQYIQSNINLVLDNTYLLDYCINEAIEFFNLKDAEYFYTDMIRKGDVDAYVYVISFINSHDKIEMFEIFIER